MRLQNGHIIGIRNEAASGVITKSEQHLQLSSNSFPMIWIDVMSPTKKKNGVPIPSDAGLVHVHRSMLMQLALFLRRKQNIFYSACDSIRCFGTAILFLISISTAIGEQKQARIVTKISV
jgi:hypothetical protein